METNESKNEQFLKRSEPAHSGFRTEKARKTPRVAKKKNPAPTVPTRAPVPFPSASFSIVSSASTQSSSSTDNLPHGLNGNANLEPRVGLFTLRRRGDKGWDDVISIETPGMICSASRGMVKHLTRDNVARAKGMEWIHVPFEDFLEHPTPVPTLHPASLPLHEFLAYPPQRHILSLSLRDPSDNQNMPANTNAWVQAKTVRGVRKVAIKDWIQWCKDSRPDLIWAFVDIPKTLIVDEGDEGTAVVIGERRQTSQKRITKSLERSIGWIQLLLAGLKDRSSGPKENIDEAENTTDSSLPPIIIPLLGGCDPRAREEFSRSLTEKQDLIDTIRSGGLQRLDDGVFGYAVEMVDLPTNVLRDTALEQDAAPNAFTELLEASLTPLPSTKIRIVHTALSPHAILQLTLKFGFDLFDVPWATEAADLGIALDLQFPVKEGNDESQPIGLNLFDERFGLDLLPLGDADSAKESWPCAPTYEDDKILHSGLDGEQWDDRPGKTSSTVGRPFTRAYIHHLLHTHEMSAYALLHLHNLAIMQAFFKGIRSQVLKDGKEGFKKEVLRFHKKYELPERLFQGARARWKEVELARGKGRLKREREAAANLSDAEMTNIDGIAVAEGIKDAA